MSQSCWREEDDYRYLNDTDRAGIAWEFLRRNAAYRGMAAAQAALLPQRSGRVELLAVAGSALRWGLLFRGKPKPPDG